MSAPEPCPDCHGVGEFVEPCPECGCDTGDDCGCTTPSGFPLSGGVMVCPSCDGRGFLDDGEKEMR